MQARDPSTSATSVREVLREATLGQHAAIERTPVMKRLFAQDYTAQEYRLHLACLLGFFEPLERAAAQALPAETAAHFFPRSVALRADLSAMGFTTRDIASVDRCRRLPRFTPAGMRGYLYVILGSMLGGRPIARRLSAILGSGAAVRFYGEGAGESDSRWTAFCDDLERHGPADIEAICATASATFDAYAAWLRNESVHAR